MNRLALLAAALFVGTVFAANYAIERWGIVPVGFGLMAPAGVYFAGLAFLLRDVVQRLGGRELVVVAIVVGALCSTLVSSRYALASGVAFLLSETCDFLVYSRLEQRSLTAGVVVSNTVGAVVDSVVFLLLAFGSLAFLEGQIVGKLWVTAIAIVPLVLYRWRSAAA